MPSNCKKSARQKDKRPTLKTIAAMAGVGTAAVSKALKDAPDISEKTKERVRLIAKEIGYQPDHTGLRLRTGKTNIINLVLDTDEEASGLVSQLIIGVTDALETTQYNLVITPHSRKKDPLETIRNIVETRAADGVIISGIAADDSRLFYLDGAGFPFVTHGRSDQGLSHAYFDFDNTAFGLNAVQLLARLKRKRVGLIFPPLQQTYGRHMLDGYQTGLQETGVESCQIPNVTIDSSIEEIADSVVQTLSEQKRPDGIICGSVPATVGAVNGIELAGFEVGKDIDVVGKQTTTNFLRWLGRPVYAINEDFKAAGHGLGESLIKIIDNGDAVEDHQTIDYPKQWGQIVTDT